MGTAGITVDIGDDQLLLWLGYAMKDKQTGCNRRSREWRIIF
jgi:hypothetical protein